MQTDKSATLACNQDQTLFEPTVAAVCEPIAMGHDERTAKMTAGCADLLTANDFKQPQIVAVQTIMGGNVPMVAFSQQAYDKYTQDDKTTTLRASGGVYGGE